jgi:hypothetical protein
MFEYKIGIDKHGTKHFKDIGASSGVDLCVHTVQVVHRSEREPYLIGFIPHDVLSEIRVGDKFHSLGMEYVVHVISDYVYVDWIQ